MNFKVDYDAATNLVAPGSYECRIVEASTNATSSGTLFFSVRIAIRDDVEQPHKGRIIYHRIWRKKEPTAEDMTVDGYSFKQLMSLCRAAQLPNGKSYASLDDLGNDLAGRDLKVTVEHEFNDYHGETEVKVKWLNKTEIVQSTAQSTPLPARSKKGSVSDLALEKNEENTGGDFTPADDDDLPWG